VGAECNQGSHVHGGLHPLGIGLISPAEIQEGLAT